MPGHVRLSRRIEFTFTCRLLAVVACAAAVWSGESARAAQVEAHSQTIDNNAFTAEVKDGWLTSWKNKRTGETLDFGMPADAGKLSAVYQPGTWAIPGYRQENKQSTWSLKTTSPNQDALVIRQQADVKDGDAQAVQWSVRLPLDQINGSY